MKAGAQILNEKNKMTEGLNDGTGGVLHSSTYEEL